MVWSQVYDPLGSPWLSTLVAALPVVVLLAGLGVFRLKAHTAALAGLAVALAMRRVRVRHARRDGRQDRALRRRLRPPADRLDHPQHHLPLQAHREARAVQGAAGQHQRNYRRPASAAPVDRLLLRRVFRGRRRLRHAGRSHRRDPDRPRLHAACGLRPVAHRQHGAGRLRGARLAGHRARRGDGAAAPRPRRP